MMATNIHGGRTEKMLPQLGRAFKDRRASNIGFATGNCEIETCESRKPLEPLGFGGRTK
jgi:hypothetical protein